MELAMIYEVIGYVASALVAISLLMTSILRLRVINIIGAAVFVVYALLIGAYPVAVVNFVIVLINIYQLNKLFRLEEEFSLLDSDTSSSYVQQFIDFHRDEIETFYPHFFNATLDDDLFVVFVLRDMLPVGLFIAGQPMDGRSVVKLDYVIPGYRDFKVGQFLYRQKTDVFQSAGMQELLSYPGNETHEKYLKRMGFSRDFATSERRLYRLNL